MHPLPAIQVANEGLIPDPRLPKASTPLKTNICFWKLMLGILWFFTFSNLYSYSSYKWLMIPKYSLKMIGDCGESFFKWSLFRGHWFIFVGLSASWWWMARYPKSLAPSGPPTTGTENCPGATKNLAPGFCRDFARIWMWSWYIKHE